MSVDQYLKEAKLAQVREDTIRALERAEEECVAHYEWKYVAAGYKEYLKDYSNAHRCYQKAIELYPDDIWSYIKCARMFAEEKRDILATAAILSQATEALKERSDGFVWKTLARAHYTLCGDEERARALLLLGEKRAETVEDLCNLASVYKRDLNQDDKVLELLDRAKILLGSLSLEKDELEQYMFLWWNLVNFWVDEQGDREGGKVLLHEAKSYASCSGDYVIIAQAWEGHFGKEGLPEILLAGQKEAKTEDDWLELAKEYHKLLQDPDQIRKCLEQAQIYAPKDPRIARGYRHWLDEEEVAETITPAGHIPGENIPQQRVLKGFKADALSLFSFFRARMTEKHISTIASADYGMDYDQHFAVLHEIWTKGLIPQSKGWDLEVLELTRWSTALTMFNHEIRAFASIVLILEYPNTQTRQNSLNETLVILIESCRALGEETLPLLEELLVWVYNALSEYSQMDQAFALLALLLVRAILDATDMRALEVCTKLKEIETTISECFTQDVAYPQEQWLFQHLHHNIKNRLWKKQAQELLEEAQNSFPESEHWKELASRIFS